MMEFLKRLIGIEPARGDDLQHDVEVTVEQLKAGLESTITFDRLVDCPDCVGERAILFLQQPFGRCISCEKSGLISEEAVIQYRLGPEIFDDHPNLHEEGSSYVKLAGEGNAGVDGGQSGDFYIHVTIVEDERE